MVDNAADDMANDAVLSEFSARDRRFILAVVGGHSASEAYRLAGWSCSDEHVASAASRKMRDVRIQDAIGRLQGYLTDEFCLSFNEKRAFLAQVARGEVRNGTLWEGVELPLRMRAIELDNRMSGHDAPVKSDVEHHGQLDLLGALFDDNKRFADYGLSGDLEKVCAESSAGG